MFVYGDSRQPFFAAILIVSLAVIGWRESLVVWQGFPSDCDGLSSVCDGSSISDSLAGVVASRLMLDGLAECRPSSFPAPLSDDDFPAVHDVQAFPESFGWRGVCANLHSKAVEDVVAFVVVSCDVADTCVWNI